MRRTVAASVGLGLLLSVTACSSGDDKARNEIQAKKATGDTLEKRNLREKFKREENPNAIGYVYLMNFGQIVGFYAIKGKVSSSGSQATPEDEIHWTCRSSHGCQPVIVDGPQDDGSYGTEDPGIFFFTTEDVKVVTSLDYIHSDQPLPIDVPRLNSGKAGPK